MVADLVPNFETTISKATCFEAWPQKFRSRCRLQLLFSIDCSIINYSYKGSDNYSSSQSAIYFNVYVYKCVSESTPNVVNFKHHHHRHIIMMVAYVGLYNANHTDQEIHIYLIYLSKSKLQVHTRSRCTFLRVFLICMSCNTHPYSL